jgi:hypothetical protein
MTIKKLKFGERRPFFFRKNHLYVLKSHFSHLKNAKILPKKKTSIQVKEKRSKNPNTK